jgi:hypothetical protein
MLKLWSGRQGVDSRFSHVTTDTRKAYSYCTLLFSIYVEGKIIQPRLRTPIFSLEFLSRGLCNRDLLDNEACAICDAHVRGHSR